MTIVDDKSLFLKHLLQFFSSNISSDLFSLFSSDRVRVRGAGAAGAGRLRHGEAGGVPHLRRLLAALHLLALLFLTAQSSSSRTRSAAAAEFFRMTTEASSTSDH